MNNIPVITVDGTAGSGKGTLSQRLARSLDWRLLDSGAIYRVLGLAAQKRALDLDDQQVLVALAGRINMQFVPMPEGGLRVELDGEDVSLDIRTEDCGCAASRVAAHPSVRAVLLELQRSFARLPGLVADGRDMGTVVFPHAELKIFLRASPEIRAKRRFMQLKANGQDANIDRLIRDITERDERDCNRKNAPLKAAADAVQIDTDTLSIDEVFEKVRAMAVSRFDAGAV